MNHKELYFDTSATIPMFPEVIETIYKEMKTTWGNPSSEHGVGVYAHKKMDSARKCVASYIDADPDDIIFTCSASAANNLALKGYAMLNDCGVITNYTEHKSIINCCDFLWRSGYATYLNYVDCDSDGKINMASLAKALDSCVDNKCQPLVSIGYASSEIGTIQDIKSIADLVHSRNGILHVDATQCFTRFPIDISNIDMMTASGSKIGAGKGIGILYKKKGIELEPLIHGGGQEQGLIAGTEDVTRICGLATALQIRKNRPYQDMSNFIGYLIQKLNRLSTKYIIHGDYEHHLDNHLLVSFENKNADEIVAACSMLGLYISAGSACNSGIPEPSKALIAIDVPKDYINGVIRITLPQDVSFEDIDHALVILEYVLDFNNGSPK